MKIWRENLASTIVLRRRTLKSVETSWSGFSLSGTMLLKILKLLSKPIARDLAQKIRRNLRDGLRSYENEPGAVRRPFLANSLSSSHLEAFKIGG